MIIQIGSIYVVAMGHPPKSVISHGVAFRGTKAQCEQFLLDRRHWLTTIV